MKNIKFTNGPVPTRFWNVLTDEDQDSATVTLYGTVESQWPTDWWTGEKLDGNYITPEGFAEDLAKIKSKSKITIKINSVGGDLYTALGIHNALKELTGHKTVIIDGIAASAASVIAMAGDTVKMYAGSLLMIHNVSAFIYDWFTINDLKKLIRGFDACERAIANIYEAKTGLSVDSLRSMMDKETWFTGSEAVEKGFADEVIEGSEPNIQYNPTNKFMLVNGVKHHIEGLHVPTYSFINSMTAEASATSVAPTNPPKKEDEVQTMDITNVAELRAQFPELVAQIEAEAVAADRARIQEIEEIQDTIGDAELIAQAKFVKPTNAASLALEAMKRAQNQGLAFMNARQVEMQNANQVGAVANEPESPDVIAKQTKEQEDEAIKNAADLFKKVYNK